MPANRESAMMTHLTLGMRSMMWSAIREGIFDWMNRWTMPMVPAIIMMTFQSTAAEHLVQGQDAKHDEQRAGAQGDVGPDLGEGEQ